MAKIVYIAKVSKLMKMKIEYKIKGVIHWTSQQEKRKSESVCFKCNKSRHMIYNC